MSDPASAPSRSDVLARLAGSSRRVRRAASAAEAVVPPAGDWSAGETVRHLIATEVEVFQARLAQLAREEEPTWAWVEPRFDDGPPDRPLAALLATLEARRRETLSTVAALDESGWARSGVHATYGRLDVAGLLGIAADHDDDHLAYLRRLRTGGESARLPGYAPGGR